MEIGMGIHGENGIYRKKIDASWRDWSDEIDDLEF